MPNIVLLRRQQQIRFCSRLKSDFWRWIPVKRQLPHMRMGPWGPWDAIWGPWVHIYIYIYIIIYIYIVLFICFFYRGCAFFNGQPHRFTNSVRVPGSWTNLDRVPPTQPICSVELVHMNAYISKQRLPKHSHAQAGCAWSRVSSHSTSW